MESSCSEEQIEITIVLLGPEYGSAEFLTLMELEQRLFADINSASTSLLIDLDETVYIGCGLLNVLLRCHQRAKHMNKKFVLCRPKPLTREVLAITRLDSLWEVFESRQEAIEALQAPLDD